MLMSAMVRAVPPTVPKAKYDVLFAALAGTSSQAATVFSGAYSGGDNAVLLKYR
jgi:hypothetical protein